MEKSLLVLDGVASVAMLWLGIRITLELRRYHVTEAKIGQWVVGVWMIGTAGVAWCRFGDLLTGHVSAGLPASVIQHFAAVMFQRWVLRVLEVLQAGSAATHTARKSSTVRSSPRDKAGSVH